MALAAIYTAGFYETDSLAVEPLWLPFISALMEDLARVEGNIFTREQKTIQPFTPADALQ